MKKGETFYSLAKNYQKYYEEDIILAKWNGKLTFMIVFSAIDENMGKW